MAAYLLRLGQWLIARYTLPPSHPEIRAVVLEVCGDVGLNVHALTDDTDLLRAGKLAEIIHTAALRLGKDVELGTVGDVIAWLAEAPARRPK